jgi:hypothetical protein
MLRSEADLLQAGCSHVLQARRSEVLRPASDLLPEDDLLQEKSLQAVQLRWSVQAIQEESLWLQQLLRPEADLLQARRSQLLRSA